MLHQKTLIFENNTESSRVFRYHYIFNRTKFCSFVISDLWRGGGGVVVTEAASNAFRGLIVFGWAFAHTKLASEIFN